MIEHPNTGPIRKQRQEISLIYQRAKLRTILIDVAAGWAFALGVAALVYGAIYAVVWFAS